MYISEIIPRKELRLYLEETAADLAIAWSPKKSYSGNFLRHSANTFGSSDATYTRFVVTLLPRLISSC